MRNRRSQINFMDGIDANFTEHSWGDASTGFETDLRRRLCRALENFARLSKKEFVFNAEVPATSNMSIPLMQSAMRSPVRITLFLGDEVAARLSYCTNRS